MRAARARKRSAGVRKDETNIRKFRRGAVPEKAVDGARGVDVIFDDAGLSREIAAAGSARGMDKDHGAATVYFFVDREERRIAKPLVHITGPQGNAVGLQRVHRVGDFLQAPIGIGQRERGKVAETPRKVFDQLGPVFIVLPGQAASLLAAIACRIHDQPLDWRKEGRGDSMLVHHVDRSSGSPRPGIETACAHLLFHGFEVKRRKDVVMHVNAACEWSDRRRNRLREDAACRKDCARSGKSQGF